MQILAQEKQGLTVKSGSNDENCLYIPPLWELGTLKQSQEKLSKNIKYKPGDYSSYPGGEGIFFFF